MAIQPNPRTANKEVVEAIDRLTEAVLALNKTLKKKGNDRKRKPYEK